MAARSDKDYFQGLFDSLDDKSKESLVKQLEDAHDFFGAYVNDIPSVGELLASLISVFHEIGNRKDSYSADPRVRYLRENYDRIINGELKFKASEKEFTYDELLSLIESLI